MRTNGYVCHIKGGGGSVLDCHAVVRRQASKRFSTRVCKDRCTVAGGLHGGGPETGYAREEGPRTEPRAP